MTTYSAAGLPDGLTINAATGLISGTVASGDAVNGPYAVDVTAGDGTYSTDQVFTWTTTGADETTPTVTAPGAQADAAGDAVSLALSASNADGAPLTYSASGLPDGLTIDPDLGVISGSVADDAIQNAPYAVTVTAADGNGLASNQTFDWFVRDAAIHVQADAIAVQDGAADSPLTVAAFTDPDPGRQATDFTAAITWGDGTTSQGEVDGGDGAFTVTGDHDYAQTGTYPLSVTVSDPAGQSVSASASASVTPAALTAAGGFTDGTIPYASAPLVVATFTDANGDAPASAYAVQINWGDNSPAISYSSGAGVVDGADGVFRVQAPHSYAANGTYTVTTTITAPDGATATATSTVQQGDIYSGQLAQLTSPWFTDPNPNTHVGDFAAWINWGDGASSYGFVQGGNANANGGPLGGGGGVNVGGGGAFQVVGYHDYATPGPYAVTVTVQGPGGGQITASTSVQAAPASVVGYDNALAAAVGQMVVGPLAILAGPMPGGPEQPAYAVVSAGDGSGPVTVGLQEIGTTYEVLWQHVYQTAGEYAVQALVYNVGGQLVGATVSTVAAPEDSGFDCKIMGDPKFGGDGIASPIGYKQRIKILFLGPPARGSFIQVNTITTTVVTVKDGNLTATTTEKYIVDCTKLIGQASFLDLVGGPSFDKNLAPDAVLVFSHVTKEQGYTLNNVADVNGKTVSKDQAAAYKGEMQGNLGTGKYQYSFLWENAAKGKAVDKLQDGLLNAVGQDAKDVISKLIKSHDLDLDSLTGQMLVGDAGLDKRADLDGKLKE